MTGKPKKKANPLRPQFGFEWRNEEERQDFITEMEKMQTADPERIRSLVDYIRAIHKEHKEIDFV